MIFSVKARGLYHSTYSKLFSDFFVIEWEFSVQFLLPGEPRFQRIVGLPGFSSFLNNIFNHMKMEMTK
jgi:hypothetical protein